MITLLGVVIGRFNQVEKLAALLEQGRWPWLPFLRRRWVSSMSYRR